jgi:hypothetical protein
MEAVFPLQGEALDKSFAHLSWSTQMVVFDFYILSGGDQKSKWRKCHFSLRLSQYGYKPHPAYVDLGGCV